MKVYNTEYSENFQKSTDDGKKMQEIDWNRVKIPKIATNMNDMCSYWTSINKLKRLLKKY